MTRALFFRKKETTVNGTHDGSHGELDDIKIT